MDERLHQSILQRVEELREFVGKYKTSTIMNTVAVVLRKSFFPEDLEVKLESPTKQCFYLIGILLTTGEPDSPNELTEEDQTKLFKLLNDIFQHNAYIFFPTDKEIDALTPEWHRCREVAMPAFLHYFNTSLLASVEQIENRIIDHFTKFDSIIKSTTGITLSEILEITNEISILLQSNFDRLVNDAKHEEELRHGLLNKAQEEGWTIQKLKEETHKSEYSDFIIHFFDSMNELFMFDVNTLSHSNAAKESYLKLLSSKRGDLCGFTYITESNPAETKPLIFYDAKKYYCPSLNALYLAILKNIEGIVTTSKKKDKYYTHRDKLLEKQTEKLFLSLLSNDAKAYSSVYETQDKTFEHDTIITSGTSLFFIEAKASPPLEPFRDPEKAYTRIKRHFNSNRGIKKGFDQAERLRKKLLTDKKLTLFDKNSQPVLEIKEDDYDNIYTVCVTRDDYGPLATNLNLLLEKDNNTSYPWVINILDLEFIVQGFNHLGLEEENLIEYLNTRLNLHGKVFGSDELEFLGFYIEHGWDKKIANLASGKSSGMTFLTPEYSDIFDKIYIAEKEGETITVTKKNSIFTKLTRDMFNHDTIDKSDIKTKKKIKDQKRKKRKAKKQSRRRNRRKK